jgi:hypothetical protein
VSLLEENIGAIIKLPSDILAREKYTSLNSIDKERYVNKTLKKILELNPNGVMISTVVKNTGFAHATVWHHLEKMTATREAYKLNYGAAQVYFANGKMVHPLKKYDLSMRDKQYSFFIVHNNFGKFLYVQEKKQDRLGAVNVCGGLLVSCEDIKDFIGSLERINKEEEALLQCSSQL